MQRRHSMPFGAAVLDDGRIRFRLWAPAAKRVELCLEQGSVEDIIPLESLPAGWFETSTRRAEPGSRYRFRLDGGRRVPDPASRFIPDDVHGSSEVIDPGAFVWRDTGWRGRPWEEAVIYELHVGTFSPEGRFSGVKSRLDYLADLGVTAIELMPVADFPGTRNWGYDGVQPFAPEHRYGRPEDFKELVQAAHEKGLMVFLDVVYNHFGPEGNYLHLYAPQFFTDRHHTPWGAAINFDGQDSRTVRDFFIHNALYWLEEYRLDGLRLDAVHAILDDSQPDILEELAEAVRTGPGKERHIHLLLENDHNAAHYLNRSADGWPRLYSAQWNDDIHHALHVLITGETDGYYGDYGDKPEQDLIRCLTGGFAYQGEPSRYRDGARRGEPSTHLPPTAFVSFMQSHDQVGNRAFGERIITQTEPQAVRAAVSLILLAPFPPMLFMGEEFGASTPFLFFCDFSGELSLAVTSGRRREFARFKKFADPAARDRIPDPGELETFNLSRLDWASVTEPSHDAWLKLYRQLLSIRHAKIVPRLTGIQGGRATAHMVGKHGIAANWTLGDGSTLSLLANFGANPVCNVVRPAGEMIFSTGNDIQPGLAYKVIPAWQVAWFLNIPSEGAAT